MSLNSAGSISLDSAFKCWAATNLPCRIYPSYKQIILLSEHNTEFAVANGGPVRIQYKCLVPTYVFVEMKLHGLVISKADV